MTQCGEVFRFRADQSRAAAGVVVVKHRRDMSQPDDRPDEALDRLDDKLRAFEAARAKSVSSETNRSLGEGYRLLWELISGVLGGAGLGWLVDQFAGTSPWGIAVGLAIGSGVGVFMACLTAAAISKRAHERAGPLPVVRDDDDED